MLVTLVILAFLLTAFTSNCAVFLWSNQQLRISPLRPFSMNDFEEIIERLDNPEVYVFKSPSVLSPNIKQVTNGYYSAFNPNGNFLPDNYTDLLGDGELDALKIEQVLSRKKSNKILSVIITPNINRPKRQADDSITISSTIDPRYNESVIYKGQNVNNGLYALLYSSKPLLFNRNDSDLPELHFGNTDDDMITYDTRLNVNVKSLEGPKIALRFSFSKISGYWYLPSVKVTDTTTNKHYNLTTDENIMAPEYFSYHCNGYTLFSDSNGVELYIYDLQVQTDSKNGKFGDVNDCVTFTTAPIWSGLFVSTLLGIGLIVALTAIMDIKTMDRFDNYKTKNLAITISE